MAQTGTAATRLVVLRGNSGSGKSTVATLLRDRIGRGVAWVERPSEGYAFSEMTGVLPGHRGQGISVAVKFQAIGFARSSHMRWLRTFHHPDNAVAIAMNRRLGFVDAEPRTWSS